MPASELGVVERQVRAPAQLVSLSPALFFRLRRRGSRATQLGFRRGLISRSVEQETAGERCRHPSSVWWSDRSGRLLNWSPFHLLYFFACGEGARVQRRSDFAGD